MTLYLAASLVRLQLKATLGDAEIYRRTPVVYVGQTRCPKCHGRGTISSAPYHLRNQQRDICPNCGGTGRQVQR